MPGVIFPPTSGFTVMDNKTVSPKGIADSQAESSDALFSTFQIKPVSFSTIIASDLTCLSNPPQKTMNEKTESDNNKSTGHSKELDISVKEAKIDPMRLMESLTSPTKSRKQKINSCQIENNLGVKGSHGDDNDDDPHKNAIEFELNISLNGRTYTARRTLPRIIQLRNDLISEMKNSSRNLHNMRQMRWLGRRHHHRKSADDDEMTVQTVVEHVEFDDEDSITIPELPQYFNEEGDSSGSFAARGFSKLQILMRSYRPVIEGWLRRVADIVSPTESPSLSTFLWEPLSEIWPIEEDFEEGSDTTQTEQ
mmetsp:Transcript_24567/g.37112  ORF Transcript_24567/g.37112 Transcript_24567/m.37112 type:complete len:309 (+) Transcript_24567:1-927(+)